MTLHCRCCASSIKGACHRGASRTSSTRSNRPPAPSTCCRAAIYWARRAIVLPGPLRPPAAAVLRPKPNFQKAALTRVAKQAASITDPVHFLAERSPVDVARQDSASVLRHLYERGTGEKVLIFTELQSQGQFLWQADQTDRIRHPYLPAGNDGVWFLPQPVCGRYLPNPQDRRKNVPPVRRSRGVMALRGLGER